MNFRSLEVRASTINETERSIEVLLTTETPVAMYDWERYERVPEVLLTSGVQLPSSRQVPLLESHQRYSTDDQLGSIRDLKATKEGTVGRAVFSSLADKQWTKVKEGHVTDVSAGYQVLERVYVPKGSTSTVQGKTYTGPINIATKWKLREGSITPIGADEQAKLRGLDPSTLRNFHEGESFMNDELRALCVERGMPTDATEEQAAKFLAETLRKDKEAAAVRAAAAAPLKPEGGVDLKLFNPDEFLKKVEEAGRKGFDEAFSAREAAAQAKRAEFDGILDLVAFTGDRGRMYEFKTPAELRKHLIDERAKQQENVPAGIGDFRIVPGSAEVTKHRSGLQTALVLRALRDCGASPEEERTKKVFPDAERSVHAKDFSNMSFFRMAEESLRLDGIDTRNLQRHQIAQAALGFHDQAGVRADPAYHTTGSFLKITQDAMNKSMMMGYNEFPSTWERVFRKAPSVQDFKPIHRMRIGALPNLPDWPFNTSPEQVSLKDVEKVYSVTPKSNRLSLSWDLLVNDDMGVLSSAPNFWGTAARRTLNAHMWALFTSNPTMEYDSKALFLETPAGLRFRKNLTTGAGAPSVSTLQTLTNLMMQMRGENTPEGAEGPDVLALMPSAIIGPSALRTTILQLVGSAFDPAGTNSITYNTANGLDPVIEPLLDASSTTAWYLAAGKNQINGGEVTFLSGYETPVTRNWSDPATLSQHWAVLHVYQGAMMNHRAFQQHAGA